MASATLLQPSSSYEGLAVASFFNNIDNIDPTNHRWVKNYSNYMLCHKRAGSTSQDDPQQALFWIVGDVDSLNLGTSSPYSSWTVGIGLPPTTNRALDALLKTGPYRAYTPPNRYSTFRVKATFKTIFGGGGDGEETSLVSRRIHG
jgi:hypothetical protein